MAISEYLRGIRNRIGNELLLTPGTSAVIRNDEGHILLHRRRDSGTWSLPGGGVDPGESPARTILREVLEETGLQVAIVRLLGVYGGAEHMRWVYPNGDEIEVVATVFECVAIGGELTATGDETTELAYFAFEDLPPLDPHYPLELLAHRDPEAWFQQ